MTEAPDFPEIGSVLKKGRSTFGKWRYFEASVSGYGMSAMIDTERAFVLAKAARVLLDEAELMGLGYSVDINATQKVTTTGDRQDVDVIHKMHTTAFGKFNHRRNVEVRSRHSAWRTSELTIVDDATMEARA